MIIGSNSMKNFRKKLILNYDDELPEEGGSKTFLIWFIRCQIVDNCEIINSYKNNTFYVRGYNYHSVQTLSYRKLNE
jgi:hypothetical protein